MSYTDVCLLISFADIQVLDLADHWLDELAAADRIRAKILLSRLVRGGK
jgi:hypothetical protein